MCLAHLGRLPVAGNPVLGEPLSSNRTFARATSRETLPSSIPPYRVYTLIRHVFFRFDGLSSHLDIGIGKLLALLRRARFLGPLTKGHCNLFSGARTAPHRH